MGKYLVEVPHGAEKAACARAVQIFLMSGSHFLTHADWGCRDGEHKAWITLEAESREEARWVLPPTFRPQARIVRLSRFTMRDVDKILRHHPDP
jgi:hypothetical protein